MSIDITMPRLSDTMEAGTIIKWNVKEGDEVSAGDSIADIETDKATMEMQVYDDGTIAKILVDEGKQVDVGTRIAVLAEEDEDVSDVTSSAESGSDEAKSGDEADEEATPKDSDDTSEDGDSDDGEKDRDDVGKRDGAAAKQDDARREGRASDSAQDSESSRASLQEARQSSAAAMSVPSQKNGRMRISPVARRLADEHEIDVEKLTGSGPSGRIVKKDVLAAVETGGAGRKAAASPLPAPGEGIEARTVPMNNMRQTIAKRLVESKTTIPHYQVTMRFNMDPLLELRSTLNEQLAAQNVKLSVNDFLIRACALAIHQHPMFNASWKDDAIEIHGDVNVGIAISMPEERGGGLLVATIRNADRLGLREISSQAQLLAEKARTRGLTIEEMADSTFTISNLGMYGVEHFTAVINPPNSAILAVGAAIEQPAVRDGQIMIGREMQATLSLDHRIIDGATAAKYMQTLKQLIEHPATLLV